MSADPRYGDPVGLEQVAGMVVVLKALVFRAGGRLELTNDELEHARDLTAHVHADPRRLVVELVGGPPPDVPRFEANA